MRVTLVVAGIQWIIGQIAEAICRENPEIEFLFCDVGMLTREPSEFRALVEQSDLVHWITNVGHAPDWKLAQWSLASRPSIATLYHVVPGEEYKVRAVLPADVIHVISSEWADYLFEDWKVPQEKIALIPLGVEREFFTSKPAQRSPRPFRIGFFANPGSTEVDRKGVDVLLKAAAMLQEIDPSGFQFVLTGPGWVPYVASANSSNLSHEGFVSRRTLRKLYQSLGVYLITSRVEGGPATVLEAMATGIPVISTPVGLSKDILHHKQTGILVAKDAPSEIAEWIQRLRTDTTLAQYLSENGRSAVAQYDWSIIARRFGKLYREVALKQRSQDSGRRSKVYFRGATVSSFKQTEIILLQSYVNWCTRATDSKQFRENIAEALSRLSPKAWPEFFIRLVLTRTRGLARAIMR